MKINRFFSSLLPATFAVLLIGMCVVSCDPKPNADKANALQTYFAPPDTGMQTGGVKTIPIKTPKGTFNVWTKRIGNNPKIKVLILHGGPGANHDPYECFESFLPKEGIEFIYYDQLGAGNSDRPTDKSLWVLPRFVEEVEQVRIALGLNKDNLYLYGQSWGGILGIEYALKYGQNLRGLIISNMMSSAPAYSQYANDVLAKQMDPKVLAEIKTLEAKGDFTNPRYMELLLPNYYEKHICRFPTAQWPEPLNRGLAKLNQEQYVTMQGPSEFGMAGDANLKNWDRSKDLPKITVPTLVIGATYDTMDPKHMAMMARQVKNGTFLLCTNGSHLAMYDDQQTYFTGLISFLKKGIDLFTLTNQIPMKPNQFTVMLAAFAALILLAVGCNTTPQKADEKPAAQSDAPEYFMLRPELEKAYGYSHAVRIGNELKISGAVSMDEKGNLTAKGDLGQQMKNCYADLDKILKHYGYTWDDVVVENILTTNMPEFVNQSAYRNTIYKKQFPTGSWFGVKELALPGQLIEIELEAYKAR